MEDNCVAKITAKSMEIGNVIRDCIEEEGFITIVDKINNNGIVEIAVIMPE